jgi:hypothetical protein
MPMKACFSMISTMVMKHLRRWFGSLNEVKVRTVITMMAVEKWRKPVSLRT